MSAPTGYEHLTPLLTELTRLRPGDPRWGTLRKEVITGYLPVAQHIARKHAYRGEDLDDLEQVAAVGLVHAVDRFRPDRGDEFLSFAVPTINGEVLRHYRDRTTSVRMTRRLQALQSPVAQAVEELSQRLQRAPNHTEIANELDLDPRTVDDVLSARRNTHCKSLDEPVHADEDTDVRVGQTPALSRVDPKLELAEYRASLAPMIEALSERERRILLLRFFGGLNQTEIAEWIGCSQMHVSRILATTLTDLRRKLTSGGAGGDGRTRRRTRQADGAWLEASGRSTGRRVVEQSAWVTAIAGSQGARQVDSFRAGKSMPSAGAPAGRARAQASRRGVRALRRTRGRASME